MNVSAISSVSGLCSTKYDTVTISCDTRTTEEKLTASIKEKEAELKKQRKQLKTLNRLKELGIDIETLKELIKM